MISYQTIGRYCHLITDLRAGMDFRLPQYRREVFLRFYEFHLRYRSHPGAVYYLFPFLTDRYEMTLEDKLWFAFINGNTQHPVTTWMLWKRFPDVQNLDMTHLSAWFNENYRKLGWDTARRYHKKSFLASVECYRVHLRGGSQADFWADVIGGARDEYEAFRCVWQKVFNEFATFGRLSTFSYLEYLRIMGLELDCDQLFLDDMSGSKSHRNGLAKVLGRDDLDWNKEGTFQGDYGPGQFEWLAREGALLLSEAKVRLAGRPFERDVSYFGLESALCTFKGWFRENRRYPNVYNDMLCNRVREMERAWGREEDFSVFWEARRACLPAHLRLEDNPADVGLRPEKQNHFRLTGQVVMMDRDWECFRNDYNDRVAQLQGEDLTHGPCSLSGSAA
jgi:hypothetical protein